MVRRSRAGKIEKKVTLNFDGKQFFVRVPNRIANEFELKEDKEYEVKLEVDKSECHRKEKNLVSLEFIEVNEDV